MKVVVDIETAKNPLAKSIIEQMPVKADARLKDPDKIAASIQQKRDTKLDKAALFWGTGRVVAIGSSQLSGQDEYVEAGSNEKEILTNYSKWLEDTAATKIMGQNIKGFDIPFLLGRMMFHEVEVPALMRDRYAAMDLYDFFGNPRWSDQSCSLDVYALSLGLDSKLNDSSLIPQMAEDGLWKEIEEHCLQDVRLTREIFRRLL